MCVGGQKYEVSAVGWLGSLARHDFLHFKMIVVHVRQSVFPDKFLKRLT